MRRLYDATSEKLPPSENEDHLPQYRIEQILKTRYDIEMPQQKLNR